MDKIATEKRVRYWTRRLGLSNWEITVDWNSQAQWDYWATVDPVRGRKEALLTMSIQIPPSQNLDRLIVHELLHLVQNPVDVVMDNTKELLSQEAQVLFIRSFEEAREQVTEDLSRLVVKLHETQK